MDGKDGKEWMESFYKKSRALIINIKIINRKLNNKNKNKKPAAELKPITIT